MKKVLYLLLALAVLFAMVSCAQEPENPQNPGPEEKEYAIGEVGPAGGWVFYDKGFYSDGWRYLEASPKRVGGSVWGDSGNYGTYTGIGSGKTNTNAMPKSKDSHKGAAQYCLDFERENDGVTYDDWFLPSLEELKVLYMALRCSGGDNHGPKCPDKTHAKTATTVTTSTYPGDYYWTSSENGNGAAAYEMSFANGEIFNSESRGYSGAYSIPVRAF